jgi:hypothetical protein
VVTPAPKPARVPDAASIVPAEGLLLLHTPPLTISVRVMFEPMHTEDAPLILAGVGNAVIVSVAADPQPVA